MIFATDIILYFITLLYIYENFTMEPYSSFSQIFGEYASFSEIVDYTKFTKITHHNYIQLFPYVNDPCIIWKERGYYKKKEM